MLDEISSRTIGHYERHAREFRDGTMDHDVSQNIEALLAAIGRPGAHKILDFGCGPGRDLLTFRSLGHDPIGLDGCEQFVEMARSHSQVEVWHQDFLALSLPDDTFDGVFANASLFHVPGTALPAVLCQLQRTLKPGGVLVCSNPRGHDEGWRGERYGCYMQLEGWQGLLEDAGFELMDHYYRPSGLPRHDQAWLVMVLRKPLIR